MDVLLLLVGGTLNVACFFIGAKVGQTVVKGDKVEMPALNPLKAIREHRDKKAAEFEQERIDTIMRNIETYNGTAQGQEDVPRG